MNCIVNSKELAVTLQNIYGLSKVSDVVSQEYACIRIRENKLSISLFGRFADCMSTLNVQVVEEGEQGELCISLNRLLLFVENTQSNNITLLLKDSQLIISDNNSSIKLNVVDATDVGSSVLFEEEDKKKVRLFVDSNKLKTMIDRAVFIKPKKSSETREHILSVELKISKSKLYLTSTDGKRASLSVIFTGEFDDIFDKYMIRKKVLAKIKNFIDKDTTAIVFYEDFLYIKNTKSTIRIPARRHHDSPDLSTILFSEYDYYISVNRKLLLSTVKRLSAICNDYYNAISFSFDPNSSSLLLEIDAGETGNAKSEIGLIDYRLFAGELTFNHKFVIDALTKLKGNEVIFEFSGSDSPCLIYDKEDESFLQLVMPVVY